VKATAVGASTLVTSWSSKFAGNVTAARAEGASTRRIEMIVTHPRSTVVGQARVRELRIETTPDPIGIRYDVLT
jgi:hypothetical protein